MVASEQRVVKAMSQAPAAAAVVVVVAEAVQANARSPALK